MIADDLFAGAGGWDLAAAALGIHARGVENMTEARATRDAAGLTTIHDDVWTYVPDGTATGLIASPPCQTFSAAGKGSGRKALYDVLAIIDSGDWHSIEKLKEAGARFGDDRTALVLTPLHFATGYEYAWLAWEQVPAVLPVWEACAEVLRRLGWNVWTGLLRAEMYGDPQTRNRALLIASLTGSVEPPTPTHSRYYSRNPAKLDEGVAKWVSMAEALGWGLGARPSPTVTGGGTETGGAEPIAKLARYTGAEDWTGREVSHMESNYSTTALPDGTRPLALHTLEGPSPTITGKPHKCIVGPTPAIEGETAADLDWVHGRPRQKTPGSVRVTVAEAGILQSFPADHPWQGSKGKQYLQCGNAVPLRLAYHVLASATGLSAKTVTTQAVSPAPIDLPVGAIAYRNGTHAHAAVRPADRPAPTAMFGARSNTVSWEPTTEEGA